MDCHRLTAFQAYRLGLTCQSLPVGTLSLWRRYPERYALVRALYWRGRAAAAAQCAEALATQVA